MIDLLLSRSPSQNIFEEDAFLKMIFSLLRRLSSSGSCLSMAPTELSFGVPSQRIAALARHLRLPYASGSDSQPQQGQQQQQPREGIALNSGFAESVGPSFVPDQVMIQPVRAAVLICIFEGEHTGDWRVILTKRSSALSTHSGEISLPGGKSDPGDKDDWETATREAKEEIGLDPSLVKPLTYLEPFVSRHAVKIVPMIGVLTNKKLYKPTPNPSEVEEIFDAPLEMFIKDENRRFEETELMQEKYLIHYFDYKAHNKKYLIWGLTAGILIRAASVVYQRPPAFLEQIPKVGAPQNKIPSPT